MLSVMSNFSVMGCPIASSFRGALLREPGIHNPDALHINPTCGYGFRVPSRSLSSGRPKAGPGGDGPGMTQESCCARITRPTYEARRSRHDFELLLSGDRR